MDGRVEDGRWMDHPDQADEDERGGECPIIARDSGKRRLRRPESACRSHARASWRER